jgi:2-dehydro-3-deoxygluconokinase
MIANKGREFGVDVGHILWSESDRAGLYFVEYGASPRPTRVIYDRGDSALAKIEPGAVDWEALLSQTRLLHVGGITPALSPTAAQVQEQALRAAREVGCLVSYDLNYRAGLWSLAEAREAQLPLMGYVDILITSLPDQADVRELISGLSGDDPAAVASGLAERFGFQAILITLRSTPSVQHATWSSLAYAEGQVHRGQAYGVEAVDRLGGGDACVAGFLTGYLEGNLAHAVRLGNAYSALTQTSPTDWPWPTRSEVEELIASGERGIAR